MKKYSELRRLIEIVFVDVERFYDKDNQSAGTRVRKAMQEIKTIAQEIRTEVQRKKNEGQ